MMKNIISYLKTQRLFLVAVIFITIIAATWKQAHIKSSNTIGDPGYETLSAAIATIGTTKCTLVIPTGVQKVRSQLIFPANITLKFEPGAVLDLTDLLDADIKRWTAANPCEFTVPGHGLKTGVYVRPYNIRQMYVSGATRAPEWMSFNNALLQINKTGTDTFTVANNSSAYHAYVPRTDPGKVSVPIIVKGEIIAGKGKIFNIKSPAQVVLNYQNYRQVDVYPEWFGAVGDGSTDDLLALNASLLSMVYAGKPRGIMHLSGQYAVSSTFSIDDFNLNMNGEFSIIGTGKRTSGFVGLIGCAGKPVLEIVGTGYVYLKDFGITGVTLGAVPADAPSVAMLLGRSQYNGNAGASFFKNLGFWGYYQYGTIYNYGYATSTWSGLESYTHTLTGKANNHYTFDFFSGMGHIVKVFPALVPTNSTFSTYANCSDDGNSLSNSFFVTTGTKMEGSACLYFNRSSGWGLKGVAWGSANTYSVYANGTSLFLEGCGGDGGGSVAGIYMASDSALNQYAYIQNCTSSGTTGPFLKTDSNTCLLNSKISHVRGHGGFTIELGAGATYSIFEDLYTLTAFTSTTVEGCFIDLPYTCKAVTITGTKRGSIIRDGRGQDNYALWLGGGDDVRFSSPGWATSIPKVFFGSYKMTWAAAAPSSGSWVKGSIIWNNAPTAGGSPGWVCTTSGTFGILNRGATTGAITVNTKLLKVNSVAGLQIGNVIDIAGITGSKIVTNIDSTVGAYVVTIDSNADTTVGPAAAISFHNNPVFKAMANLAP